MTTTLVHNARVWQWAEAALAGPVAMLEAADRGAAHLPFASWILVDDESGAIVQVGSGSGLWLGLWLGLGFYFL